MIIYILKLIFESAAVFLIGTVLLDIVHYFFHQFLISKNKLLNKIGQIHLAHHRFFSPSLKIELKWKTANFWCHVLPEYCIQITAIYGCLLFFQPFAVFIAASLQTLIFFNVCYNQGMDRHHKERDVLQAYRGGPFVNANYHALHHIYPKKYFSSYVKLIDYLFGTGHHLVGQRIAMTGANGALGAEMKLLLEKEGAIVTTFKYGVDYTYDNYEKFKQELATTDILFLCHGTKYENTQEANCDSFVNIIEIYKAIRQKERAPIEVWAVGSEIECHPCFGIKKIKPYAQSKRNYARYARSYFHDKNIQYRHIVHSAFTSRMGRGLMSARFAAIMTLFFLKRGFKYIPITYTGFGLINYLRYIVRPVASD